MSRTGPLIKVGSAAPLMTTWRTGLGPDALGNN